MTRKNKYFTFFRIIIPPLMSRGYLFLSMRMLGPTQVLSQDGIPLYALRKTMCLIYIYIYIYIYIIVSVFMQKCGENFFLSYSDLWRVIITSDHTLAHTLGRCPLDGGSARRRDLYLTTHMSRDRQVPGGIRTQHLSGRAAADPRLRPRGHRD